MACYNNHGEYGEVERVVEQQRVTLCTDTIPIRQYLQSSYGDGENAKKIYCVKRQRQRDTEP